jgi:hypothetical protein
VIGLCCIPHVITAAAAAAAAGNAIQALGKVMGSELPHVPGGSGVALYPASVKPNAAAAASSVSVCC